MQIVLNFRRERVRAAEDASRDPFRFLERRHGLAEIVERGAGVPVVETPAEQVLATGCCDGLAHYVHAHPGAAPAAIKPLWQTASRQLCFWHTDRVTGVAFARGLFATSCQDRCLRFFDAATGQVAGCIDGSTAAECLCFSASGEWILGGDGCGKIEAYHVPSHIPWELITLAAAQNGVPFSNPFADAPARVGAIPSSRRRGRRPATLRSSGSAPRGRARTSCSTCSIPRSEMTISRFTTT